MGRAPHILWAEDDPADQALIRASLEELPRPPRVAFAEDGVTFLEALGRDPPALAVLDLKMPRMGGLEAAIRAVAKPIPLVAPVMTIVCSDIFFNFIFSSLSR